MIFQRVTAVLFVLALSACGGGGSGGGGDSTPISVITVSDVQTSLDGTYTTGCRQKNLADVREDLIIRGGNWTYARYSFSLNDGVCGGTETLASSVLATLSSSSGPMGAISGWTESGGSVAAPNAADGLGGTLSDTELYTLLTLTATAVTGSGTYTLSAMGDTVDYYYVVDDTGVRNLLYIPDFAAPISHMLSATPSGSFTKL